jgi:hypothetical protein
MPVFANTIWDTWSVRWGVICWLLLAAIVLIGAIFMGPEFPSRYDSISFGEVFVSAIFLCDVAASIASISLLIRAIFHHGRTTVRILSLISNVIFTIFIAFSLLVALYGNV